jgi:hypothetical protein
MKALAIFFLVILGLNIWYGNTPKTAEDPIVKINDYIAPDGYLTKTHLYIHWPAEYTKPRRNDPGGKELVPVVTMKIPVEYLNQSLISFENAAKIAIHDSVKKEEEKTTAIDYFSLINQSLFIADRQIMSVSLRFQPGAKPYVLELSFKDDPPDVKRKKDEHFFNSYAVHIDRNTHFSKWGSDGNLDLSSLANPPEFDCSGDNYCHIRFGINGRMASINGWGEGLDDPSLAWFNQKNNIVPKTPPNGLPKWHTKLDPTQALLNSFIVPEDSPEIKSMFSLNK